MFEYSKNLKYFKRNIGHLNHFLITIEIALSNIDSSTHVPDALHTTWNPQDINASISRSREWARKSAIIYTASVVEAYFDSLFKEPLLIQNQTLLQNYNDYLHSHHIPPGISKKMHEINRGYNISEYEKDLVMLLILWRNGIVHNLNDFTAHPDYTTIKQNLRSIHNLIYENHCHLEIDRLLFNFENKKPPSMKEVTSMIKASIDYITTLDMYFINDLNNTSNMNRYIKECLHLFFTTHREQYKKYSKFTSSRKIRFLENILCQYCCFSRNDEHRDEFRHVISDILPDIDQFTIS